MTTVMLRTDEELLAKATEVLAERHTSLEEVWERALREITEGAQRGCNFDETMDILRHVNLGGPYSRAELNER